MKISVLSIICFAVIACKRLDPARLDLFQSNVPDTAMIRFNRAWLLDSTNADVFWGLGSLLGNQKKFGEAILLFKKSIHLHPDNPIVWASVGQSYGNLLCTPTIEVSSTVALSISKGLTG